MNGYPKAMGQQRPAAFTLACESPARRYSGSMFSIEHEFDATVVTLVDDSGAPLQEDVTIELFEECVVVRQFDPRRDEIVSITFSNAQLRNLAAALDLPEGVYQAMPRKG